MRSKNKEELTYKEVSADKEEYVDLSDVPPLKGDKEEVREGKGIKNLFPDKLLT